MTGKPQTQHAGRARPGPSNSPSAFAEAGSFWRRQAQESAAVDLCVIGMGYIGLPTAAVFAAAGLRVRGVDVDPARVRRVNAGDAGLAEPGLDRVLQRAVQTGRLVAADTPAPARVHVIAVPTPLTAAKQPDLSHVDAAAAALAPVLERGNLVILESTVPVGATRRMSAQLAAARPDLRFPGATAPDVMVAHCPERVMPGRVLEELRGNDRVIGGLDAASAAAAANLFRRILAGRCHLTDAATAEMTKLAENAYRDVNIAFANELAVIAEGQGIDPRAVIGMANRHPRVDILQPGPGVGGHCIAVDPWFLAASARGRARLIPAARAVNDARPAQIAAQAAQLVAHLDDPVIACFGLSYKRDTEDLRESPAVDVVRRLAEMELGQVLAVEPHVDLLPAGLAGIDLVEAGTALSRANLAILLVDHTAFAGLAADLPASTIRLDTRGLWQDAVAAQSIPATRVNCAPQGVGSAACRPAPAAASPSTQPEFPFAAE